jgi:tyrocidine synthetase-3
LNTIATKALHQVKDIEIVSSRDKKRIMEEFNSPFEGDLIEDTIHECFVQKIQTKGNHIGLVSVGRCFGDCHLSYAELHLRSLYLAGDLACRGIKKDCIVGIMADRSFDMVIGIFSILKAGGAYLPLLPGYPGERIRFMLKDSEVNVALSSHEYAESVHWDCELIKMPVQENNSSELPAKADSSNMAYVIYTSGSTGLPKGVMVEHKSVLNLLLGLQKAYPLNESDTFLLKTSYLFDVSVTELFGWFWQGGRLAILNKGEEQEPYKILQAIESFKVTHINFVPSMFNTIVDTLTKEDFNRLNILKYIFLAGEALPPQLVRRFRRHNQKVRLENLYGPSEATIYASGYSLSQWDGSGAIPIGKPLKNVVLYIFDKDNKLQVPGVPGELFIGGTGVARGYVKRHTLTRESFIDNPYFKGERLYKSGDLCRWLPDGNIEFLGRKDQQVKIRGFRIEMGEIQNHLLSYNGISEAVVVARKLLTGEKGEFSGEKHLCAYIKGDRLFSSSSFIAGLKDFLSRKLPNYMVPTYFVPVTEIPLTPSGKVNRELLPEPGLLIAKNYVAPRNEIEENLLELWKELLDTSVSIGIDDNFFELGGHSLRATSLLARIHKILDVEVLLSELFQEPTIRGLYQLIRRKEERKHQPIKQLEKKEFYGLTSGQKRFFAFQQLDPSNISYSINEIMKMEGRLEREKFERVFRLLVERHESFRTSFRMVDGVPVQIVDDHTTFNLELYNSMDEYRSIYGFSSEEESDTIELDSIINKFVRPFDLGRAPLLRVGFIKITEELNVFMIDMHHIISDGTSAGLFIHEFLSLYFDETLPALRIHYKEYAEWSYTKKQQGIDINKRENSKNALDEEFLNLPYDFARPSKQTFEGKMEMFQVDLPVGDALKKVALEQEATFFMVLLSAFNIFLSKLSNQENIVVGSPIAGRGHSDLDNIIGLFINTIVLRNYPQGEKTFETFLKEVKSNSLEAFENQDFQYEEFVEIAESTKDSSRNPLFDVMLVLQNMDMPEIRIPGITIERNLQEHRTSKFDMTLYCQEKRDYLEFILEYNINLFKETTIQRFIRYFKNVLKNILKNPNQEISCIELTSDIEKQKILREFNFSQLEYSKEETVCQAFEKQVEKAPTRVAILGKTLNVQCNQVIIHMSYQELNEKINQLARILKSKGVYSNIAVGIMISRSVEMVLGIFSILKAGGAYLPIDSEYPVNRILRMLNNSGTSIILTDKRVLEIEDLQKIQREMLVVDSLDVEQRMMKEATCNLDTYNQPEDLIYMIFTSGSTGIPKGAGVYHRSFYNLMNWFIEEFGLCEQDKNLFLTSLSFDLTQKNIYSSLMRGGKLCIPDMGFFDPAVVNRRICESKISWINCTPSMFNRLVELGDQQEFEKLKSLRYVYLGGEPIAMSVMRSWIESRHFNAQIVNTYGPTECTDICASFRIEDPNQFYTTPIPVGKPIYNVQLYVLDKNLMPVPIGIPGELCISGDGVGLGYVNDGALTSQKFIPLSWLPESEAGPYIYRTGDQAKWLPDGNIEYIGRIDLQVKIRGFRIELGEIESQLIHHPGIKEAVVTARQGGGAEKYLCAYIVPNEDFDLGDVCLEEGTESKTIDGKELREYLIESLPDYMVPVYFVILKKVPLTPNGKVDKKALPEPKIIAGKDFTPPTNEQEEQLVYIWADILKVHPPQIGIDDNFFEIGGHSLKAADLTGKLFKEFGVEITITEVFNSPTIRGLSYKISQKDQSLQKGIFPMEEREYYELSSAQKRLFILHHLKVQNVNYNMPMVKKIQGSFSGDKLKSSLQKLITRHESLRTSFKLINDAPVQRVHPQISFEIEHHLGDNRKEYETIVKDFVRPFDLSTAPLFRVGWVQLDSNQHLLLFDMHHIISDAASLGIFIYDFMHFYEGKETQGISVQYKDFAQWQNKKILIGGLRNQEEYWLKQYSTEIPVLNLPTDFPRPFVQQFEGNSLSFFIDATRMEGIKNLIQETDTTLYMMMLSIFYIFLAKITSQEDVIVGSPLAGRINDDLQGVIGAFINVLPLRNFPRGEVTFQEFLQEVKKNFLEAFENQEYQLEELVEKLSGESVRDASRNPLFDTMFVLQNVGIPEFRIHEGRDPVTLTSVELEQEVSKFDMAMVCEERAGELQVILEYSTHLFKPETIKRFQEIFILLLEECLHDPLKKLYDYEIILPEEKRIILYQFNYTEVSFEKEGTLHRNFESQAEKVAYCIALKGESQISFGELNKRANVLAQDLKKEGVSPYTIVALLCDPSIAMIISVLAIIKAGGAYLPISPAYPQARKRYLLSESSAQLLLVQPHLISDPEEFTEAQVTRKVYVYESASVKNQGKSDNLEIPVDTGDPAYLIYTSGTTGNPKGVLVSHRNAENVVTWFGTQYKLEPGKNVILVSDYTFDASVNQIFGTLLQGATLCVMKKELLEDLEGLRSYIRKNHIHLINFIPSLLHALLSEQEKLASLDTVISGAEELKEYVKKGILEAGYTLYNQYGPTETTIDALSMRCTDDDIRLGAPISNVSCFIFDKYLKFQPVGIPGELFISGAGVSSGYLNRLELTAEKFIKSPMNPSEVLYRSGDLAKWLPDGTVVFLGRIDEQVKVRGYRIELGEISNQLQKHEAVKEAVVVDRKERKGETFLYACLVLDKEAMEQPGLGEELDFRAYLSVTLPDYMIPLHFTIMERIPYTIGGKIDRKALPKMGGPVTGTVISPRNEVEIKIVQLWREVLDLEKGNPIGIDDNFFLLGGHSLKATILISKFHREFDVKFPLGEIFRTPTVRGMSGYINRAIPDHYISINPEEKREYYPLSSSQKRLYFLWKIEEEGITYNVPQVVFLEGAVNQNKMELVFKKLIARHDVFKTSFELIQEKPAQRIRDRVPFFIQIIDYQDELFKNRDLNELIQSMIRPFNLTQAPLLRAGLIKTEKDRFVLWMDMHHIVTDAVSMTVFVNEFMTLYSEKELLPIKIQYKDFTLHQGRRDFQEELKNQEAYWLHTFKDEIQVLNLPLDFPRPAIQRFEGDRITFNLEDEESLELREIAYKTESTHFMLFLGVFNVFLARLTGEEEIVIGTPVLGRKHEQLENMIGMFVNTLPLRNYPTGEKVLKDFLEEVKDNSIAAFENQEYPFEDLVEKVSVYRDPGRNPIFDVMYVFEHPTDLELKMPDLLAKPGFPDLQISKFDLTLKVVDIKESFTFTFEYSTHLFSKETIEGFVKYFKKILSLLTLDLTQQLMEIEILVKEERDRLLFEFNRPEYTYPNNKTIPQLFKETLESHSLFIALSYEGSQLTYQKLDQVTDMVVKGIFDTEKNENKLVGIRIHRSLEMIVGILGVLKSGKGYVPMDPKAPKARIQYIKEQCNLQWVLSAQLIGNFISSGEQQENDGAWKDNWQDIQKEDIAYVIFTSGSTGLPKGVPISHFNFCPLVHWGHDELGVSVNARVVQNLSYYFDWSVWEIFLALFTGAHLYMAPEEILLNPETYVRFIRKMEIEVLHITPSQFQYLVKEGQNFESMTHLFIGAEKLTYDLVKRSIEVVDGECRIFNMYGPTETTIISAVLEIDRTQANGLSSLSSVPIGKPVANGCLLVMDKNRKMSPINVRGELYISGDGLSTGYLGDSEKTKKAFVENEFDEIKGDKLYRTGDQVRWLPNGTIEFLGRIDQQVKIRGYRIELGEIENQLLEHPEVKEAVVLDREREDKEKYICAYIVRELPSSSPADKERDFSGLRECLSQTLPEYMIPSQFIKISSIPLTPNGKIDRNALPVPGENDWQTYIAPRDDAEKKMVKLWEEVLTVIAPIGMDDNFFQRGGHSLKATILISKIHKTFHVKFPLGEIFRRQTVRGMLDVVRKASTEHFVPVKAVEKRDYYPLSSAQNRLYFLWQMEKEGITYNVPQGVILEGDFNVARMEEVFERLIDRHESLRTSFEMMEEKTIQRIYPHVSFSVEYPDSTKEPLKHLELSEILNKMVRPFDLAQAPLLRVGLIRLEGKKHALVTDMHHIITDGVSAGLLVTEFIKLYSEESLEPLRIYYKDYASYQNSKDYQQRLIQQENYWSGQFEEEVAALNLPYDYTRPAVQRFEGDRCRFNLNAEETRRLTMIAEGMESTLFLLILGVFNVFLSRLSGEEEIIVGTPAKGRKHTELENMIGMFVNTLPLRNSPSVQKSLEEFLLEVKDRTLQAFENQEYPFEELVEKLSIFRDAGRNPIFDVMCIFEHPLEKNIQIPGLRVEPVAFEINVSKFDLTLKIAEREEDLLLTFEYSTHLFKMETIQKFIVYFKEILHQLLENPGKRLSEVGIVGEEERATILYTFNRPDFNYPVDKTIPALFKQTVNETSCHIALSFADKQLTYQKLDQVTDGVVSYIDALDIQNNNLVGIQVPRSLEMIIGILGILKSGMGYVPMDPKAPSARLEYIREQCHIQLVLNQQMIGNCFGMEDTEIKETHKNRWESISEKDTAYVIFTSGSTGLPKGVPISHSNFCPLIHWGYDQLGLKNGDRVVQNLSYYFDWSVWEIFIALTTGSHLYMVSEEILLNSGAYVDFLREMEISVLHITPTQFQYLVNQEKSFTSMRHLFIGAEKLTYDLVKRSYELVNQECRVFNMYGPTEATIISAVLEIERDRWHEYTRLTSVPIGKPAANACLLVLDKNRKLSPVHVRGELFISGPGLSTGYLGDSEKTRNVFVQNEFIEIQGERLYRTGDQVRWLPGGDIEFLGRIDDQVKIRGYRIELGEIENQLLEHKEIKEAVVIDREKEDGEQYICAYIVGKAIFQKNMESLELREFLSNTLPDYMIPSYFVMMAEIPLTRNKKVDKRTLPMPEIGKDHQYVGPGDEIEKQIVRIWAKVLGIDEAMISVKANFFELGGHSLKAAGMISRIKETFNVDLALVEVFRRQTICDLAKKIRETRKEGSVAFIPSVEKREYYDVTHAQKRIWVQSQFEEISLTFNMLAAYQIDIEIQTEAFYRAFQMLLEKHEILRTLFVEKNGVPKQRVLPIEEVNLPVENHDFRNSEDKEGLFKQLAQKQMKQLFDLSEAPLFRVNLVRMETSGNLFMFAMHHIISDAVSMGILYQEVLNIYDSNTKGQYHQLKPLRIHYKDYAAWQNQQLAEKSFKIHKEYWLRQLEGVGQNLELPLDYDRPEIPNYNGDIVPFIVDKERTGKLKLFGQQNDATLFMVLTTILNVFLYRFVGQEDLVIGTLTAGRGHTDLEKQIGCYLNTLPLRTKIIEEDSFEDILKKVRDVTISAFGHQEYPFDMLVEDLGRGRDVSHHPLFDVVIDMINYESFENKPPEFENELDIQSVALNNYRSLFDLVVFVYEKKNSMVICFGYNVDLFEKDTIDYMADYFKLLMDSALKNPLCSIDDFSLDEKLELSSISPMSERELLD